jgi:hypothetical protein
MTPGVTCATCGGYYNPLQADGLRYYHRCPMIPNAARQPDFRKAGYDPRSWIPMPGARDENLATTRVAVNDAAAPASVVQPKAPGAGTTPAAPIPGA